MFTRQFVEILNKGLEAAKMITEADKKALAYAELAKAVAQTGLVTGEGHESSTTTEEQPKKEAKKETKKKTGKDSLSPAAGKGKKKTETAPESVTEPEVEMPEEEIMPEVEPTVEAETAAEHPGVDTTHVEAEVETEVELDEEWTDAMCELKAEALERYNAYCEAWGEDFVNNDCVERFFEGAYRGAEYIRPTNIDGFISYLDQLSAQE